VHAQDPQLIEHLQRFVEAFKGLLSVPLVLWPTIFDLPHKPFGTAIALLVQIAVADVDFALFKKEERGKALMLVLELCWSKRIQNAAPMLPLLPDGSRTSSSALPV
jgi:hypothetical protein